MGTFLSYAVDVLVKIKSWMVCDTEMFYLVGPVCCVVVDLLGWGNISSAFFG